MSDADKPLAFRFIMLLQGAFGLCDVIKLNAKNSLQL